MPLIIECRAILKKRTQKYEIYFMRFSVSIVT